MSDPTQQHKIFKAILRAIVSDEFAPDDYQAAISKIRDGSLMALLEQIVGTLAGPRQASRPEDKKVDTAKSVKRREDSAVKSADSLFNDVKRRKITRDQLETTQKSIDPSFTSNLNGAETMRALLKGYREHATDREWKMLGAIINGDYEADPYLASISAQK